jgi:CheY-like chemotaxis protein
MSFLLTNSPGGLPFPAKGARDCVGMTEETRRKCLEPFFTTKGERGTGLGLAMGYGMVQRHRAQIEIVSEPGKGTTMSLIFPAAATSASADKSTATRRPIRDLRILVIDDDPRVLKSFQRILEADGHLVSVADGGQSGIDTFIAATERGEPFALVISDLGMPHVDGSKVAAAIKAASPDTPVVLLTGWGHGMRSENDLPPHVDHLLSKPPDVEDLRWAIERLTAEHAIGAA